MNSWWCPHCGDELAGRRPAGTAHDIRWWECESCGRWYQVVYHPNAPRLGTSLSETVSPITGLMVWD